VGPRKKRDGRTALRKIAPQTFRGRGKKRQGAKGTHEEGKKKKRSEDKIKITRML